DARLEPDGSTDGFDPLEMGSSGHPIQPARSGPGGTRAAGTRRAGEGLPGGRPCRHATVAVSGAIAPGGLHPLRSLAPGRPPGRGGADWNGDHSPTLSRGRGETSTHGGGPRRPPGDGDAPLQSDAGDIGSPRIQPKSGHHAARIRPTHLTPVRVTWRNRASTDGALLSGSIWSRRTLSRGLSTGG